MSRFQCLIFLENMNMKQLRMVNGKYYERPDLAIFLF